METKKKLLVIFVQKIFFLLLEATLAGSRAAGQQQLFEEFVRRDFFLNFESY